MGYNYKEMKKLRFIIIFPVFIFIGLFTSGGSLFASSTNGTIDPTYKYAWSENTGWINFGTTNGDVHVTDSELSGYALSENIGWINLENIVNDGEGNLSGFAWSENTGYIKFNPTNGGVIINSEGFFTGSALSENIGWIIFDGDYKVKTDWRPRIARPICNNATDDDSDGKIDYPDDPGCSSLDDTDETDPSHGSSGSYLPGRNPNNLPTIIENKLETIVTNIWEGIKETTPVKIVQNLIPDFLKPETTETEITNIPIEEAVPKESQLVFDGKWNLLFSDKVKEFVLAPLPRDILKLAQKFPELKETLKEVGINKITDIEKLRTANFTLPGLSERVGLLNTEITSGKFALPDSIPLAKLTIEDKKQIPSEIIFAKTSGQLIDFNINLSLNDQGETQQKITTIVGKPLELVVKPDSPVKSVKGYVVFKSKNPNTTSSKFSLNQIALSSLFASPILAYPQQEKEVKIEEKLVLLEFEYTDPDGDGLYTANIESSLVEGEYEIITVMEFEDPTMGKREIRLITVVDPEGYIYTNSTLGQVRINKATASIYWLNPTTKEYELWDAKEYQQENPQITDDTGKYSFLVPPGKYYLKIEHSNYYPYQSEIFEVKEGSGVHMNIELKVKGGWLKMIDWKILLVIIFGILLLYIFYRDKIRERLFKRILENKLKSSDKIS